MDIGKLLFDKNHEKLWKTIKVETWEEPDLVGHKCVMNSRVIQVSESKLVILQNDQFA